MNNIYPLTVVKESYNNEYTAWNLNYYDIPVEVAQNNHKRMEFCDKYKLKIGIGYTIDEAVDNLAKLLENSVDNK